MHRDVHDSSNFGGKLKLLGKIPTKRTFIFEIECEHVI